MNTADTKKFAEIFIQDNPRANKFFLHAARSLLAKMLIAYRVNGPRSSISDNFIHNLLNSEHPLRVLESNPHVRPFLENYCAVCHRYAFEPFPQTFKEHLPELRFNSHTRLPQIAVTFRYRKDKPCLRPQVSKCPYRSV